MSDSSILVCGSGIVGLATAVALGRAGLHPQILGPRQVFPPPDPEQYYPRVYAVSPASQQFLASLGVWGLLDSRRVTPVQAMQVYGDAGGHLALNSWQGALPALAWILESSELERVLQQVVQIAGIPWHTEKFQSLKGGAVLSDAGRQFKPELLIGADGASSAVRTAASIAITSTSYNELGVVSHLSAERPHGFTARQWFGPDGIVALLPLPDTRDGPQVSLVWSLPAAQARQLLDLPAARRDEQISVRLQAVTGGCLGALKVRSPVLGFPLTLAHTDRVAPGVALVGDAAQRVHPLAGQGLNLGLGDVEALAAVLSARAPQVGVGDASLLRRYRRRRAEAVMLMGLATDGLHHLFAPQAAPLVALRNLGLGLVNRMPFIKRYLIEGASRNQAGLS